MPDPSTIVKAGGAPKISAEDFALDRSSLPTSTQRVELVEFLDKVIQGARSAARRLNLRPQLADDIVDECYGIVVKKICAGTCRIEDIEVPFAYGATIAKHCVFKRARRKRKSTWRFEEDMIQVENKESTTATSSDDRNTLWQKLNEFAKESLRRSQFALFNSIKSRRSMKALARELNLSPYSMRRALKSIAARIRKAILKQGYSNPEEFFKERITEGEV